MKLLIGMAVFCIFFALLGLWGVIVNTQPGGNVDASGGAAVVMVGSAVFACFFGYEAWKERR